MRYLPYWCRAILVLVTICGGMAIAAAQAAPDRDRAASPELLVKVQPATNPHIFAASTGMRFSGSSGDMVGDLAIYRMVIADGSSPAQKIAQLANNPKVIYSELNSTGQVPEAQQRSSWVVGGSDSEYFAQWAPAMLQLDQAHRFNRGDGVIVAVLDTGVDQTHPMLAGHLISGYDFVDEDIDPQETGQAGVDNAFGHGTHVAGLVALAAPGASIMPLRTLRADGTGDIWTQVRAIRYAVAHGASVINLSFSFDQPSQVFSDVLAQVTCATASIVCRLSTRPGAIVLAAAGNTGLRVREYPAAAFAPGVLGVGASSANDTLAAFSTYGAWVQIMAPGDHILSTIPGGGYASWSGTSMAAPLVAGVAALVRSAKPALRPVDVVTQLITTAAQTRTAVRRRLDAAAALGLTPKIKLP